MPEALPLTTPELVALADKYGTPLQLYDGNAMQKNAQSLISTFQKSFPGFREFFAVKALPNPAVLKLLLREGCGLDCSSTSELYIAKKLGVPGDMVMYTSNFTSKKDLAIAFDQGVVINLDDISLIDALVEARGKCSEVISFRLNPGLGRTDSETASNILGGPDAKFGVSPEQIVDAYRKAKAAGAKRFGIHMMTGSCVLSDEYWEETVEKLLSTCREISSQLNIKFDFFNIGGGLGIPYRPGEKRVDVDILSRKIRTIYDRHFDDVHSGPRLYMENGRYMTGPYGYLVSRCQAIKKTFAVYYGLDACMANLMRPGMYGSYHHISVPEAEERAGDADLIKANVVGTLCENNDWFAKGRLLPGKCSVGDLFIIFDTGAHSHSMGFQYNGKLRAPEILLRDGKDELIRERETIPMLYANTVLPDDMKM